MISLIKYGGMVLLAIGMMAKADPDIKSPIRQPQVNQQLIQLEAKLKKQPENVNLRAEIAELLSQSQGEEGKIIEVLNPYADELKVDTQLVLAAAYHRTEQYKDEVRVLKKVVERSPKNQEAHYILGHAHLKANNLTDSTNSFRMAISLKKNYRDAYEALLGIFEKTKNNYESRNILRDMQKVFGKDPVVLSHMCRLNSMDGYIDSAITTCRLAIQSNVILADSHVYLAQSLSDKKDESKAGQVLIQASKKFPNSEFVQWAAGQYYFKQSNFPVAKKYFARAISADETSSRAHLGLALCQFEEKEYDKALKAFTAACKIDDEVWDKIREASGKLRQIKEQDWSRRYAYQVYECKKH